jgi:flagellar protein FlaG
MEIATSTVRLATTTTPARPKPAAESGRTLPANGNKPPPAPSVEDIQKAVQQIQSYLSSSQRQLQFTLDEGSGRTVITVMNPLTGEKIRQIPAEEVVAMSAAMQQQGLHLISELV